ncbi:Bioproteinsis of lysosome- organelles complex 1 subunit 1 [Apophysomyces ossiformis]|uniref:Biogenesis of lysosome-related organelles complex 1 subunit 1 n=1 Tax=Apophysomyces ossiformis TaxID=679940 RepID=A0A8H7BNC0_9FUNG|nr:Bioproteinsis of lysosome- organelles complex 1 subunit 1 [Apophysomyces ossiformis]
MPRINDVITRQKVLEQELRGLVDQTARYTRQTKQWLSLVDNFNSALKEIGDIENWATVMEHDMRTIMSTLEFVHQGTKNEDETEDKLSSDGMRTP